MNRTHAFAHAAALIAPMAVMLTQCKQAEDRPAPPQKAQAEAKAATPSLADKAEAFGFAGKMPLSAEFYVASVNLQAHAAAVKASAFGKDLTALISDKTPAPAAGDKTVGVLSKLFAQDFFIAGCQGFAESAASLRDMNHLMNEMNIKQIMGGTTGALSLPKAKANPLAMLDAALHDPEQMRRVKQFVTKFQLPPVIAGFKTDKPAELAKEILGTEILTKMSTNGVRTSLTTPEGFSFQVLTVHGAKLFPKTMQDEALGHLPADISADVRKSLEQIFEALQSKKFVLAIGSSDTHVLIAAGGSMDHVKFVTNPSDSVLANPEMNWLIPHTGKNLLGIAYANAAVTASAVDEQPVVPILRGVVGAMKENKLFKDAAAKLDGQLGELASLESLVYSRQTTALAAAAWWEKGLHIESYGGAKPRQFTQSAPLKFSRFLDAPGVVFGFDFQRNLAYEKAVRSWMEKLVSMTYGTAKELVQSGTFGSSGGQQLAMFDQVVLPTALKLYEADLNLHEKGLNGEMAFLVDINGKLPALPMMPPDAKGSMCPRVTTFLDVADRKAVGDAWQSMSASMAELNKSITGAKGPKGAASGGPGVNPAAVADLAASLQPMNSEKNGMTTWFYPLPFLSGDVLPCAAINDKLLIVSSSKDAADAFAAEMATPISGKTEGLLWKFDIAAVTEFAVSVNKLSPSSTPEQRKQIKQMLRWLKPFGIMRGNTFQENGQWRSSFTWDIKDVLSFD